MKKIMAVNKSGEENMQSGLRFDYYYGLEAEQFSFYRIPRMLMKDDRFKCLSSDAKLLYGLMLDRMSLSMRNGWFDDENRVYIIYTLEDVMEDLNCGKDKGVKIMAELDGEKGGVGLIERKKRGLGRPAIIYVKNFITGNETDTTEPQRCSTSCPDNEVRKYGTETGKSAGNQDFGKTEVKTSGNAEVKTSEKPKSGVRKNRSQEFGKTDPNYTDYNYNNNNYINPINLSINQSI